jgi:hypothetical protein
MSEKNKKTDDEIVREIKEKIKSNTAKDFSVDQTANNLDWKNPEEVKDFLENLYVEYSFQCISEKNPEGCHRLANFMENIRSQFKDATELYKKNCDEYKYPRSCLTYAKNKTLGRGIQLYIL